MYTIVETPVFQRYAKEIWSDDELTEFKVWLANNALAGDVIPGTGGMRKVRWSRSGMGKRGGARVIYFNLLADGVIALFIVYCLYQSQIRQFANNVFAAIEEGV
ncbi:MAG: transcriptional regulator [Burkholderiaceae bacterium]